MKRLADISRCGRFRFLLLRDWLEDLEEEGEVPLDFGRRALFIMLNPSTADGEQDDPTIRKCIGFSKIWGCTEMAVVNLFPFRATNPKDLRDALAAGDVDPVAENLQYIAGQVTLCAPIVCAWGDGPSGMEKKIAERSELILNNLAKWGCTGGIGHDPRYLRMNKSGNPQHPLYLPYDTSLKPMQVLG